jgi:hypothetical protein
LIVDLLQRIEDDDMGVMNIVAQGFVACCKRQSGCVCFFENTKIRPGVGGPPFLKYFVK